MEQLVSTQWLQDELGSPDLVVLDCTVFLRMGDNGFISESGRQNWAEGHIPGAGFADLKRGPRRRVEPFALCASGGTGVR